MVSWIIAIAIATAIGNKLFVKSPSIVGKIAKTLTAIGCSTIGTVIGALLFSTKVLSLGSIIVAVAIASLLILLVRGKLADL